MMPGQIAFAAALIWLGVLGLRAGDFVQIWQPVPAWVPALYAEISRALAPFR